MAVIDLYFKQMKRERNEYPDVYTYDTFPDPLKVQIMYICNRELSQVAFLGPGEYFFAIVDDFKREIGKTQLPHVAEPKHGQLEPHIELQKYFQRENDVEMLLSVVQLVFDRKFFERPNYVLPHEESQVNEVWRTYVKAVDELNQRFQEHAVGYRFESGQIVRLDSQYTHAEITKPALRLLSLRCFASAQEKFLKAHEHYRKGNYVETITVGGSSLESALDVIVKKRKWSSERNPGSGRLIAICIEHGLIPNYFQSHFDKLKSLLKGVPTIRNEYAHGDEKVKKASRHLASFSLNLTASAIVFLAEADQNL